MSWGTSRRNTILFILFIFIAVPVGIVAFILFYEKPNCFDNKQNGSETGVDCGGTCQLLCTVQQIEPVVLWERSFRVADGVYNLLAYVENPNTNAYLKNASYEFKMYNEENVLIGEKTGVISIAPKSARPILVNNVQTFEQIPMRVEFKFTSELVFEQAEPKDSIILIKDEFIENEKTSPRVKAKIQNLSLKKIEHIDVVVLLYDVFDNVIATSNTYVDVLDSEDVRDIVFTWPQGFVEDVARIELIPIYDFE